MREKEGIKKKKERERENKRKKERETEKEINKEKVISSKSLRKRKALFESRARLYLAESKFERLYNL